jgi:hypothetical protein
MEEYKRRAMQTRLIHIKNQYERFAVSVEKLYDTPDAEELVTLVRNLADGCGEYLKSLRA